MPKYEEPEDILEESGDDEASDWFGYETNRLGPTSLIMIDLQWFHDGTPEEMEFSAEVSVAIKKPGPDGLATQEEAEKLDQLSIRLLEDLVETHGGGLVANRFSNGRRFWLVQAMKGDGLEQAIRALADAIPGYPLTVSVTRDPEWKKYQNLLPTAREHHEAMDELVLEQLAEQGDDENAIHTIEHVGLFEDERAARRFESWAAKNGFTITAIRDPDDDTPQFAVEFSHKGKTKRPEIGQKTWAASKAVADHEGEYDGWGTMPVVN